MTRFSPLVLAPASLLIAAASSPPPPAPFPLTTLAASIGASVNPLEGVWRNTRNTVHIRAARCGSAICGTVVSAITQARIDTQHGTGRDLIGLQLFRDFRPAADNSWKGKIFIPDLNQNAAGKIVLTDRNSITVSGCVMFGLACKTQHWKRIA